MDNSETTGYTVLAYSYEVGLYDALQFEDHIYIDTDYSCHIKAVELKHTWVCITPHHRTSY